MSFKPFIIIQRSISTTSLKYGRKNPRRFFYTTKGKTKAHDTLHRYRPSGGLLEYTCFLENAQGVTNIYKEAIPELVVPDLTDFKLKPYVSYRVRDVVQKEMTAKDLFDACYAKQYLDKCTQLLKSGKVQTLKEEYQNLLEHCKDKQLIEEGEKSN